MPETKGRPLLKGTYYPRTRKHSKRVFSHKESVIKAPGAAVMEAQTSARYPCKVLGEAPQLPHMHTHSYTHTHMHTFIYTHLYTHIHMYTHIYTSIPVAPVSLQGFQLPHECTTVALLPFIVALSSAVSHSILDCMAMNSAPKPVHTDLAQWVDGEGRRNT